MTERYLAAWGRVNTGAVTVTSHLRTCGLRRGDGQLQPLCLSDSDNHSARTNPFARKCAMQIVDPMNGVPAQRDDDVARLQSRARGWATWLDRRDQHTAGLHEAMRANGETGQRHILPTHTDAGATHVPVRDQLAHDELDGVHRDRETDALRRQDYRGVDTDHAAARVEERATRIPGIERRVRLDHVIDQSPGN